MISALRKEYNKSFSKEKYDSFIRNLENVYPGQLDFRIAETPVFVPKAFTQKLLEGCEAIVDVVTNPDYLGKSEAAIPAALKVPGDEGRPEFMVFDFAVVENENGQPEPRLIEMQGFPSIFAWHVMLPEIHEKYFGWPQNYSPYLNGFDRASYTRRFKEIIVNGCDPEQVILLEVLPQQQKTRVDFNATETLTGVKTVDLNDVTVDGERLFYRNRGRKIPVKRIYNRVIFDDLLQQSESVREKGKIFQQPLDVTWVPHPNWFYRISKFTLPFIKHRFVPETQFLHTASLPDDLANYVVKPLFSFAGRGVIVDVTEEELDKIDDKANWIIQRKISYAPVIKTPGESAKAEIRVFYFWPPAEERPIAVGNLARLSKGKMIGVSYNKDKDWVGGSFCLFEQ